MAMPNPSPFTMYLEDLDQGLIPLRTKTGKKIHLLDLNSTLANKPGYALCTAGRSIPSRIEAVSSQEIQRGHTQINCLRCLKIHELNVRSGRSQINREPEATTTKRYPADSGYEDSRDLRQSSSEREGSAGFIIAGILLLIIAVAGIIMGYN